MTEIIRPDFGQSRERRPIRPGDPPVVLEREYDKYCAHEYVSVLERTRVVVCRNPKCRVQVDPVVILLRLIHDWNWATHWQEETDKRRAYVEELKREEQKVKARIKRAGGTVPSPYELVIRRRESKA